MKQGLTCHILIVASLPLLVLTQGCLTKVREGWSACRLLWLPSNQQPV
uniref:Uncharacterized protein n=1 Tax=Anguilla anguilla TaxID=7936 RepID=A0A0E9XM05_ANGAN